MLRERYSSRQDSAVKARYGTFRHWIWGVLLLACLPSFSWSQEEERRPRRELSGILRAATAWGCLIETEAEGPAWVLFREDAAGMPAGRDLAAGLPDGIPRLPPVGFLPGMNGGGDAGIPIEFVVRVTTLVDAIPDGQRVRFRAILDEERRRAINPIRYLEFVAEGVPEFGDEDEPSGAIPSFPGDEPFEGVVVGRAYRSLTVMVAGRRMVVPYTANAVLRILSNDPRFVALGDRAEVVGRERVDGLVVATRIRVEHMEAPAMEALQELREQSKLAAGGGAGDAVATEEPSTVAVDGAMPIPPIDPVAGGVTMEAVGEVPTEPMVMPVETTRRAVRVFGRKVKLF